ncbi:MAG TPA: cytidylate kinase-like family protein [Candidatus Scatomonas merdigallinarum]|nr:cytidylate kinase-like family protein [Candidatus Scatomonas merdigallinarum]
MNTIITISRQHGSAGLQIGRELAKELNIPCYDKELLERAAKDSGLCKEIFEANEKKPTSSFLYSLVMDTYSYGYSSGVLSDMPLNQKVFLAQFDTIKQLAKEGPCVFIGRCADYALEDNPNCLSVFVHADLKKRIRRVAAINSISDAKAKDIIQKMDKSRASYYNYYTCKKWGDMESYHVCLDSGIFGIDGTVNLLKVMIEQREQGFKQAIFNCKPGDTE